jgi:putative methionine-R-sulfoxide reductase with GAF domain
MSRPTKTSANPAPKPHGGLTFQSRLSIGVMLITVLAIAILGYFTLSRQTNTMRFVNALLTLENKQQAEEQLLSLVTREAENADQFFNQVTLEIEVVAGNAASLLTKQSLLGDGAYWDAQTELQRLSEGQWGNSATDPASVLAASSVMPAEAFITELNTLIYLDMLVPTVLDSSPDLLALYFVGADGATIYYPNIDLANLAGDFDARQRPYFQVHATASGPSAPYWSSPYADAALNGLVETNSVPVYNEAGEFRGIVAADLLITTLTDRVAAIEVAETGYAFLVDPNGNFVTLPQNGWDDFALPTDPLSETEVNEFSIQGAAEDISAFAGPMLGGERGVGTFTRQDQSYYLAYAPISSTGYSLGVVVPVDEMIQISLLLAERLSDEAREAVQLSFVIIALVLISALLFSYILGRFLARPIVELTEAAEQVAAGHLDVDVDISEGGELGRLALAFNEMTGQIQELVGDLEGRIAARTRVIETSMEISRSLSTVLDQQQLLAQMVDQVQMAFNYYHVHIYVLDEVAGLLRLTSGTGEAGYAMLMGKHEILVGQGLVGQAAVRREAQVIPNVALSPDYLPNPLLPDTKSEAAIPIMVGNQVLGVLDVQQNRVDGISDLDADLLKSIASQVGVAMRNARLFEQVTRRANREAMINQIGQEIQYAPDIESVLQIAARQIGEKLGVQRASVQLLLEMDEGGEDNGRYTPPIIPEAATEGR